MCVFVCGSLCVSVCVTSFPGALTHSQVWVSLWSYTSSGVCPVCLRSQCWGDKHHQNTCRRSAHLQHVVISAIRVSSCMRAALRRYIQRAAGKVIDRQSKQFRFILWGSQMSEANVFALRVWVIENLADHHRSIIEWLAMAVDSLFGVEGTDDPPAAASLLK